MVMRHGYLLAAAQLLRTGMSKLNWFNPQYWWVVGFIPAPGQDLFRAQTAKDCPQRQKRV
jgi:hypothetical protein